MPAFGTEWYPRDMYMRAAASRNIYGDPNNDRPYHNFINGAADKNGIFTQFAPKLTSEGGGFDPEDWVRLIDSSGAKFAGQVAGTNRDCRFFTAGAENQLCAVF